MVSDLGRSSSMAFSSKQYTLIMMEKPNKNSFSDGRLLIGEKLEIPRINYGKFAVDTFSKFGDKIALIDGTNEEKITYAVLAQKIVNTAASLHRLGIRKGDVIAICTDNRIEFMITVFAVIYIGAIATFINSSYSKDDITHTTNISKPNYVCFSPTTFKKYRIILRERGIRNHIVYEKTTEANSIDFNQLSETNSEIEPANVDASTDTAVIVYSSGTTGLPKGAKWTHLNLIIAALQYIASSRPMVSLSVAPWTNTVGYICTSDHLMNGNTVVFLPRFNEKLYLQCIEKYRVTFLIAVPPLVVILCKSTILKNYDVSSIEIIFSGGAPLEAKTITGVKQRSSVHSYEDYIHHYVLPYLIDGRNDAWVLPNTIKVLRFYGLCRLLYYKLAVARDFVRAERGPLRPSDFQYVHPVNTLNEQSQLNTFLKKSFRFKSLKYVVQGYGMTEASGGIAEETETMNKQGSVGKVVPEMTIKVVHPTSRKILGPNERGEVCLKGLPLFGGYIGKDTKEDYDDEGFFKTGDIAYYDEDGYIFVVDRIKELIKFKSWQVSPSELEAVLLQHPGVKDAAVVGRPDSLAGELPTAFVVRQPGTRSTAKEIFDFVSSKVSPWKQLKGGITFVQEIPKNGSGKILRRMLMELLDRNPPSKL